jgi:hypothetical protein
MNYLRIMMLFALVLLLVACSGTNNEKTNELTASEEETGEHSTEAEDSDSEDESAAEAGNYEAIVQESIDFAGSSTAHVGYVTVEEMITQDTETLKEQTIEVTYAQNEMMGSENRGYQLRYHKKVTSSEEVGVIETAYYRQPSVAEYKYYGPEDYWHANDYSYVDAEYFERLDFMSPYDLLMIYEKYKDVAEVTFEDNETLQLTFEVSPDEAIELDLHYQYLEPESYYYSFNGFVDIEKVTVTLEFSKQMYVMLNAAYVEAHYRSQDDPSTMVIIQCEQKFDSYMLTDEIRPPEEAFTSSGLAKWD